MGRKKTPGNRSTGGRKKKPSTVKERTAHDYGNERCQYKLERFRNPNILGGKAAWIDIFDGVGQLHAVGMLEGHGLDGKLLREAAREYIGLYFYVYVDLATKGSDLERGYGGKAALSDTRRDFRFAQLDDLLPVGSLERKWTHRVLLNHFGLDTVDPLVDRLVNYKMAQWKIPALDLGDRDMRVAGAEDFHALGYLLRGLFALADGAMPERWQRAA